MHKYKVAVPPYIKISSSANEMCMNGLRTQCIVQTECVPVHTVCIDMSCPLMSDFTVNNICNMLRVWLRVPLPLNR